MFGTWDPEEKAAWLLETHESTWKDSKFPGTSYLLSDGRIIGGGGGEPKGYLDRLTSRAVLQGILDGLKRLGR